MVGSTTGMSSGMDAALVLAHHIHCTTQTFSIIMHIYISIISLHLSLQYAVGIFREAGNRREQTMSGSSGGGWVDEIMDGHSQCVGYLMSVIENMYSHMVVP